MRAHIALIVVAAMTGATAADFRRVIPQATWEPIFFESINALTRKVHWQPLRTAPIGADSLEVRVWIGFGRLPLQAYRIRRNGTRWSAQHVVDRDQGRAAARVDEVRPKSGWTTFWQALEQKGILTLPDSSSLPGPGNVVADGESYVVEINTGNAYRTYEYGNPHFQRSPEAKKIISIIKTLHRELGR